MTASAITTVLPCVGVLLMGFGIGYTVGAWHATRDGRREDSDE